MKFKTFNVNNSHRIKGIYILYFFIALLCFFVFRNYLSFKYIYLFKDIGSDTLNSQYPFWYYLSDYFRTDGIPRWTFAQGMGQNIFNSGLSEPFNWIMFIIGGNHLPFARVYIEVFKIFVGGTVFYLFLRTIPLTKFVSVTGGLLYAFCGFMILGGQWFVHSSEAVMFAILLYSYERLYKHNNPFYFILAIAIIAIHNPFYLYMFGLFLFLYVLVRYIDENDFQIKKFVGLLLKIAGLSIIGVLISAALSLPYLYTLLSSPRGSGNSSLTTALSSLPMFRFPDAIETRTILARFFSVDMLGSGSWFRGWNNYLEAPIFYSGLISLLMFPLLFNYLRKKGRIAYGVYLAIWLLPLVFPYFRYSFWLFTGAYYRHFSFFIAFIILFLGLKTLNYIDIGKKVNIIYLLFVLILLLILLYNPFDRSGIELEMQVRNLAVFFLVIYSVLLMLMNFKILLPWLRIILFVAISVELGWFSWFTVNKRMMLTSQELNLRIGYNDYTKDAINYIKSSDKNFFRVDKYYPSGLTIHTSMNDNQIQGYYSTESYHSFNQVNYIKFLQETYTIKKNDESSSRWSLGLIGKPILESFASVKYILTKDSGNYLLPYGLIPIEQFNDVRVFYNPNSLPLGFTYDQYLPVSTFNLLSPFNNNISLLKAVIIEDKDIPEYSGLQPYLVSDLLNPLNKYTLKQLQDDVLKLKQDTFVMTDFHQNYIAGNIFLLKSKLLFFTLPFDKGWSARIDGKSEKIRQVNIGFSGLLLKEGRHIIELKFIPPYIYTGLLLSIIGIAIFIALLIFRRKRIYIV